MPASFIRLRSILAFPRRPAGRGVFPRAASASEAPPRAARLGQRGLGQRGFGLLEVAVLAALIVGAVVGGIVSVRALQSSQAAEALEQVLRRADRAVLSFAATHDRLPCPDVDGDGLEDAASSGLGCAAGVGQKGWLPLATLGLAGAGADQQGPMPRLLYLVQRHAQDLAQAQASRHNPPAFDTASGQYSATRPLNQLATTDLCEGIERARAIPVAPTHAHAGGVALAYAIVHPGARAQAGSDAGFEGDNRLGTADAVEPPTRAPAPGLYDDRVWAQSYSGLAQALQCETLLASSRTLGFAAEWVDEVNEQKQSTLLSSAIASTTNLISSGVAAIKTGLAVKGLVSAISHLSAASTALAAAIASCVVIVGCALIPSLTAAVATAIAAIAAYSVTIGLAATSLAASLVASGLSIAVAVQAGNAVGAGTDLTAVRAQAQDNLTRATQSRIDAQNRYNTAVNQRDTTYAPAYTAARSALESKVSGWASYVTSLNDCGSHATDYNCSPPLSLATYQGDINAIAAAVDTLATKDRQLAEAEAALSRAQQAGPGGAPTLPTNPSVPSGVTPPSGAAMPTAVRAQLVAARDAAQAAGDTERVIGLNKAIDYLDNQQSQAATLTPAQRAADLTQQINEVQAQIDGFDARIADIDAQLAGTPCSPMPTAEPQRSACADRAMLSQQRAQSVQLKATLQEQRANLSLDVATATALRNTAQSERAAAASALESAQTNLLNRLSAMRYTTCTRGTTAVTSGDPPTTTHVPYSNCTVRDHNAVAADFTVGVLDADGNTVHMKDIAAKLNQLHKTKVAYSVADQDVAAAHQTLLRAQQDEADAQATVHALNNASSGAGLTVWSGAADVLQRADAKGGIR